MPAINEAISGDYNVICDVCGFKLKRSQCRKRWDGLLVCNADWESRHPQDSVRGTPGRNRPLDVRPEPPDRFVDGGPVEWDSDSVGPAWDDFAVKWENGAWVMWDGGVIRPDEVIDWDQNEDPIDLSIRWDENDEVKY